jgi:hypothetical protein
MDRIEKQQKYMNTVFYKSDGRSALREKGIPSSNKVQKLTHLAHLNRPSVLFNYLIAPMKKTVLIFLITFSFLKSFSQNSPVKKEKPPTQKEMQEMMREMQQGMDSMSAEEKMEMEKMGIKIPDIKSLQNTVSGVSDKQLEKAWEEDNRIVPLKDVNRINSIPKAPLTPATIEQYLSTTHAKIISRLSPEVRSKGEEIYSYLKGEYPSNPQIANTAAGLWIAGKPALALYLMGQACLEEPEDANILNNYASMLTMCGAEESAIPILNNLNNQFSENSTLLNNLGQAWFGLGEMGKAEAYLDSTIQIYRYHPQANLSKGAIEENKGNIKGAIEAVKRSIKGGYSLQKAEKLEKLGSSLGPEDIPWNDDMPQDALGLDKFTWPQRPIKVNFSDKLEEKWGKFNEACSNEISVLELKANQLEAEMERLSEERMNYIMAASQQGEFITPYPRLAIKAMAKLSYLVVDKDGSDYFSYKGTNEALMNSLKQVEELETKLEYEEATINQEYKDAFGEGKSNPYEAHCATQNSVRNNFLASANGLLDESYGSYLKLLKRKINDYVYYYQYTQWPEVFEVIKVNAKIQWLSAISGQRVYYKSISASCDQVKVKDTIGRPKLQEFDDVACKYKSEMDLGPLKMKSQCSHMTTEFDAKFVKLKLNQNMDKETFSEQFVSTTIQVKGEIGLGDKTKLGPLEAGAKAEAGVEIEIDRSGVQDVSVIAGIKGGVSIKNDEGKVKLGGAGINAKISLISGNTTLKGTGVLSIIK